MSRFDDKINDMSSNNKDDLKRQVLALVARGLSLREVANKVGVPRSTIHRWTKGVLPASSAASKPSAPHLGGAPDLGTVEGLSAEQARLYAALGTEGFDRGLALQITLVSKRLTALQESGCADHWTLEDVRRLCASLNGLWLRRLEIASRDMTQVGQTNATRILFKAIEKVSVEAEVLQ